MSLADDLRKRREQWHTVGDWRFLLRRPRELELARWNAAGGYAEVAVRSVAGWQGPKVDDIFGNGEQDPAPFSEALAAEWLPDRLDLLKPLWDALQGMLEAHARAKEAAAKN